MFILFQINSWSFSIEIFEFIKTGFHEVEVIMDNQQSQLVCAYILEETAHFDVVNQVERPIDLHEAVFTDSLSVVAK